MPFVSRRIAPELRRTFRLVGPYCVYCDTWYEASRLRRLKGHRKIKAERDMKLGEDVGRCPYNEHVVSYVMEDR